MNLPKDAAIYPFPSAFNEKELDVIGHAIGYEVGKVYRRRKQLYFAPYRNYYYCNADDETWNGLVKKGFAEKQPPNKDNCSYFSVTNECLAELTLETSIYFYSENAKGNEIDAKEDVIEVLLDHAVYCGYGCWIPPGAKAIAFRARLPYKLTLSTLNYLKKCGYVNHFYKGGIDDEGFPHCTHGWGLSKKWIEENKERYEARQQEEYMKEVAEIVYDCGLHQYADIGCDSNLTACFDVLGAIQEIRPRSKKIERIERGIYEMPKGGKNDRSKT